MGPVRSGVLRVQLLPALFLLCAGYSSYYAYPSVGYYAAPSSYYAPGYSRSYYYTPGYSSYYYTPAYSGYYSWPGYRSSYYAPGGYFYP